MNDPELVIYGQIGSEVSAVAFLEQLRGLGDVENITVRINSKGGSVFDGYAIYNALHRHPANVRVEIDGIAASAASYIAMAGDRIFISENAEMMVHCGAVGIGLDNYFNANQLESRLIPELSKVATALRRIDNQIAGMYAARTGHKHETWMRLMEKETTFTAEDAVKKGLADEMIPNKAKPGNRAAPRQVAEQATFDLSALAAVAEQINSELEVVETIAESVGEHVVNNIGYGKCPECGADGAGCERSINGNTWCTNGHRYPHSERVYDRYTQGEGVNQPTGTTEVEPEPVNIDEYLASLNARAAELKA